MAQGGYGETGGQRLSPCKCVSHTSGKCLNWQAAGEAPWDPRGPHSLSLPPAPPLATVSGLKVVPAPPDPVSTTFQAGR